MIFATFPRALHNHLHNKGAKYYLWEGLLEGQNPNENLTGRLVCDWSIKTA